MFSDGLHWPRAIVFVDMNAFFASIEQLDNPALRGKPVAVTNGERGSCIITCSYEARYYGIKTGMRLAVAKALCPHLIHRPSRPQRYACVSKVIMQALHEVTPDLEVFSIDEAFLDVTYCQRLLGHPEMIARLTKQRVFAVSGLTCSVGVSGDKTTAKFAANCQKPDGFTVIEPWEARQRLHHEPVSSLCGIGRGISQFLAQYGAYTCGDVTALPISVLVKRFGPLGRRIWHMCHGADYEPVHVTVKTAKTMGHGKIIPPNTREKQVILTYFLHLSEKLAARMRRHHLQAQYYHISLRSYEVGKLGDRFQLTYPSNDSQKIYQLCKRMLALCWQGESVFHVQVTAISPQPEHQQSDLFYEEEEKAALLNDAVDAINQRHGQSKALPAKLMGLGR